MIPPSTNPPFTAQDDDPKVQAYRLRCVESDVKLLLQATEEIRLLLAKYPQPCPRPGLCIEHAKSIEELEKLVEQGRGAWKLATVVSSILTFAGSFIGFKFFWK